MGKKDDAAKVYVYVGKEGAVNLERGIQESVWGWKHEAVEGEQYQNLLASLKAGDRLYLGHLGLARVLAPDAQGMTVRKLVVATLTGGVYQDSAKVWDDEDEETSYPYRVPLRIEDTLHDVTNDDIGPEGIEALRLSLIKQGTPQLAGDEESVMEAILEAILKEEGKKRGKRQGDRNPGTRGSGEKKSTPRLLDWEDPDDRNHLELPSVLDLPRYTLARREQKLLRTRKLKGRDEVPCDLCQVVLPKRLVHTAHIKRRSRSSHQERQDLDNVMFACVLGCDSLFEHGYVYIDTGGYIHASDQVRGEGLTAASQRLGVSCSAYSEKSADYFAWHRENVAGV